MPAGRRIETAVTAGFRSWVLHDDAADLHATWIPGAGMLGASLVHHGEELLWQGAGPRAYGRERKFMGIPFLHPWANRLERFGYRADRHDVVLDPSSPLILLDEHGLPIHGVLTASRRWVVQEIAADSDHTRLVAGLNFDRPELLAAFPFPHRVEIEVQLGDGALQVRTTVIPTSAERVPLAFGFHPYLRIPGVPRAHWEVSFPVRRRLLLDGHSIPTGDTQPVSPLTGLIGERTWDDGFDGFELPARFELRGGGRVIGVEYGNGYHVAQVAGSGVPLHRADDRARQRPEWARVRAGLGPRRSAPERGLQDHQPAGVLAQRDRSGDARVRHRPNWMRIVSYRPPIIDRVEAEPAAYGEQMTWSPQSPRFRLLPALLHWLVAAISVLVAALIVPHVTVGSFGDAVIAAGLIGILNAIIPPLIAAIRVPFTLSVGFLVALILNALILLLVSQIDSEAIKVDSFGWALLAALVMAAASVVLEAILGVNDDDTYTLRVIRRIARRQGGQVQTNVPGIIFLEIDGLGLPILQRAMRDGNVPVMADWLNSGTHQLAEWETDLSSQTGASQAGILLGSNEDVPAFRWVEKASGKMMTCSSPEDCAEIERRRATGDGLLTGGGTSRGNLFSGEADAVILTVSRISAEKHANPGYRTFFANGFNVSRLLVLFCWEVVVEWVAAIQQRRRNVLPRGARGGGYPFLRAALCVGVRDLIVFGVLTDMIQGRPAVYATFSSYDEVAHHSGLERADTLEALRKLDQQFGRIARAARFAPRPYKLAVLSDHGQTQGATFKQRNGYDLSQLVERSLEQGTVAPMGSGDENHAAVGNAVTEATGVARDRPRQKVSADRAIALASGNLGLIYLMEEPRRLTAEEISARHPGLLPALREHPDIGFVLVRSSDRGAIVIGAGGLHYLIDGRIEGEDPLAPFPANAAAHLRRTDQFEHAPDILVNSFYDPEFEQGCAFEELISFHGGLGGPQTRPFLLHPPELPLPSDPILGATQVHAVLSGWRRMLQGEPIAAALPPLAAQR